VCQEILAEPSSVPRPDAPALESTCCSTAGIRDEARRRCHGFKFGEGACMGADVEVVKGAARRRNKNHEPARLQVSNLAHGATENAIHHGQPRFWGQFLWHRRGRRHLHQGETLSPRLTIGDEERRGDLKNQID
jgi:hypothetical protein